MTIVEKAAYLKGLTAGLGLEADSRDARLWAALNELLSDMAHKLEALEEDNDAHEEAIDSIYEQLIEVQEFAATGESWGDWMDDEEVEDDEDALYTPSLRLYEGEEDEDGEEDTLQPGDEELAYDGVLYDVTCPNCGETVTIEEETLEQGQISCPSCGETLEFDLGDNE